MDTVFRKAEKVQLLAVDVDGVLTDGRLYFAEDGQEFKTFDTQDGHGMKMLQQAGMLEHAPDYRTIAAFHGALMLKGAAGKGKKR